jgi:hypothetical protein
MPLADLLAAEPRLAALSQAARACPPDDWVAFNRSVVIPLRRIVGWFADEDTQLNPRLRDPQAYEVAYRALVTTWELAHDRHEVAG